MVYAPLSAIAKPIESEADKALRPPPSRRKGTCTCLPRKICGQIDLIGFLCIVLFVCLFVRSPAHFSGDAGAFTCPWSDVPSPGYNIILYVIVIGVVSKTGKSCGGSAQRTCDAYWCDGI